MKHYKIILFFLGIVISSCSHAEQKEIKASEFMKDLRKGKSVSIANKIIIDDVDFTSIENLQLLSNSQLQNVVEGNIFFSNCVFMGNITSNGMKDNFPIQTKFCNNLIFTNCDFRGDVNFENAVVQGNVNFNKAKFRKNASFNNFSVWSKDSYFSEIESEGDLYMIYASFYGNLYMMDGNFQKNISMQNAVVNGKFMANGWQCLQSAEFDMISVRGRAIFNYSNFGKEASFIQARFFDDVDFVGTTHENSVNFEGAYFYGKLNLGDVVYPSSRTIEELKIK
ncbi:MAG: pentapeptide repeat-containing protein [Bacteroidales bacterium]|nr:pentapeptide repeat-containing protein [Bacteroidales bacterium]